MILFTWVGYFILFWILLLAIMSRVYILRLLSIYGIVTIENYPTFLKLIEQDHESDMESHEKKLNNSELKQAVEQVKNALSRRAMADVSMLKQAYDLVLSSYNYFFVKEVEKAILSPTLIAARPQLLAQPGSPKTVAPRRMRTQSDVSNASDDNDGSPSPSQPRKSKIDVMQMRKSLKRFASVIAPVDTRIRDIAENMESHMISKNLGNIFLFKSPALYFFFIDLSMMSISFYMSFWLCNYVHQILRIDEDVAYWVIVSLLPGVLSIIIFAIVVESAVLLYSISHVDADMIQSILEQQELAIDLGKFVRDKILCKLDSLGEGREFLEELFRTIDTNNSDMLSRAEFQFFCTEMSISFSKKRWRNIFKEIDRNSDNEISFDELFMFLYPESQEAIDKERLRMEGVREEAFSRENSIHHSDLERHYDTVKILHHFFLVSRIFSLIKNYFNNNVCSCFLEQEIESILRMSKRLRRGETDKRVDITKENLLKKKSESMRRLSTQSSFADAKAKPQARVIESKPRTTFVIAEEADKKHEPLYEEEFDGDIETL